MTLRDPVLLSTSWGSRRSAQDGRAGAPTGLRIGALTLGTAVVLLAGSALAATGPDPASALSSASARTAVVITAAAAAPVRTRTGAHFSAPRADADGLVLATSTGPALGTGPALSGLTAAGGPTRAQGAGQVVAVLDSGVDPVPALAGRVIQGADFSGDGFADHYGHGTFVAGLIAGNGRDTEGRQTTDVGVAPEAEIVSVKVISDSGEATVRSVSQGLLWVLANERRYKITEVNLSLQAADTDSSFNLSVIDALAEAVWDSGVPVVVAAGNSGARIDSAPADDPTVITVGSSMLSAGAWVRAPFSSFGPTEDGIAKPEVSVPGVHIQSTLPAGTVLSAQQTTGGLPAGYGQLSGTSLSAAILSGEVADLQGARPGLSPQQVKAALVASVGRTDSPQLSVALSYTPGGRLTQPAPSALLVALLTETSRLAAEGPTHLGSGFSSQSFSTSAVWSDAVWSSAVWSSAVWSSAVWSSAVWSSAVWSSAVWSDAVWSEVVLSSTVGSSSV